MRRLGATTALLVTLAVVAGCSSSPAPSADIELSSPGLGLTDEQMADLSERAAAIDDLYRLSDEELQHRITQMERQRADRLDKAQVLIDEVIPRWELQPCPAGGSIDEAFFDPPGDAPADLHLDLEPHESWLGYEIVRVADLVLASGVLLESGGEYMGSDGTPVAIAEPGTYPYFMAMARYKGFENADPALAQLVLDPTSPPVRWEDDGRFGFGTDAGSGWIGSPEAVAFPEPDIDDEVAREAWIAVDQIMFDVFIEEPVCTTWARDDGANSVLYSNGYGDGFFPAAAGYDADDRLVAITWFFGHGSWVLAGIPGVPPEPVQDQIDCRRAAQSDGSDPAAC